jgi:MoaA/NifB/PqqE/SkfB family radical SAM enzyme
MSREIKVLHLESTDVCQAACPLCARETNPDFNKNIKNHLRIDQLLEHFNDNAIAELDKVFMCGNYGDPVAGKNINPSITLGINTNGALQTTAWWSEVGKLFNNPTDYVVFSIDGLADTNSIYRVNVIWEKVMNNAKTFIDAGGSAHWDMLVYKHNQHQVESAEQLSRNMGFSWFRAKVSKRTPIAGLEQPDEWADPLPNTGPIQCHVLAEKSAYIDAQGRLYPCCWLGNSLDVLISDISEVEKTWYTDNPNPTCKGACSTSNSISRFKDQWRKETQLK